MSEPSWRIVLLSTVPPAVLGLDAIVRGVGHETVALITPRLRDPGDSRRAELFHDLLEQAPEHLDLCVVPSAERIAPLLRHYEPDLALCMGYPWRIPSAALAVPSLGILNGHPSLLPRHRGPLPIAWAFRKGDAELGYTFHLMDADFDTGPILAQGSRPMPPDADFDDLRPLFAELTLELLPRALARLAAGERGDPQPSEGATYAPPFSAEDVWLDLSRPAREGHNLVRAWQAAFSFAGERGPLVELSGEPRRLLRTSLEDPGDGAARLDCADGTLWVVEHEAV